MLILTADACIMCLMTHAPYGHCTWIKLGHAGVNGNGHMMLRRGAG